jgi:hypothetical protein
MRMLSESEEDHHIDREGINIIHAEGTWQAAARAFSRSVATGMGESSRVHKAIQVDDQDRALLPPQAGSFTDPWAKGLVRRAVWIS